MNKEILRVLEEERARREGIKFLAKDINKIMIAARHLQSFAAVDQQGIEKILYDEQGMPK